MSKCLFGICDKQTYENTKYCKKHKCHVEGCEDHIEEPDYGTSSYCRYHRCQSDYCYDLRIGSFCKRHTCSVEGCDNFAIKNSRCHRH
jgi:hypothetical protein